MISFHSSESGSFSLGGKSDKCLEIMVIAENLVVIESVFVQPASHVRVVDITVRTFS